MTFAHILPPKTKTRRNKPSFRVINPVRKAVRLAKRSNIQNLFNFTTNSVQFQGICCKQKGQPLPAVALQSEV